MTNQSVMEGAIDNVGEGKDGEPGASMVECFSIVGARCRGLRQKGN